ncbi:MAG: cache domain-containing protein, partial [Fusobacteriota bacterium]
MSVRKKYVAIGLLIILSYIIISILFIKRGVRKTSNIINREIEYLERDFTLTKNHYREITKLIYESNINKEDIKNLIFKAWESNTQKRNHYRKALHKKIDGLYNTLNNQNIRQLHFHFKDNTSFLRMHRPEKFGDDLSGFRETVEIVNRTSLFYSGFEEGRIFNGYRYVYPLSYKDEHIGSVEISVSLNSFLERLSKVRSGNSSFILEESIILEKVFKDETINYKKTDLSENYYYDKDV